MKLRKALEKNSANRGQWRIEPLSKPGLTAGQRVQEEEGVRFQVKSANDLFEKREQQQRDKNKKKNARPPLQKQRQQNWGNFLEENFAKKCLKLCINQFAFSDHRVSVYSNNTCSHSLYCAIRCKKITPKQLIIYDQ